MAIDQESLFDEAKTASVPAWDAKKIARSGHGMEAAAEQRAKQADGVDADIRGQLPDAAKLGAKPPARSRSATYRPQPPVYVPVVEPSASPEVAQQALADTRAILRPSPRGASELPKIPGETIGGLRRRMIAAGLPLPEHIVKSTRQSVIKKPTPEPRYEPVEGLPTREELAAHEAAVEQAEFAAAKEEQDKYEDVGADQFHGPIDHTG